MSDIPFHTTIMGHRYYDQVSTLVGKVDRFLSTLERIASALEALAKARERDLPSG